MVDVPILGPDTQHRMSVLIGVADVDGTDVLQEGSLVGERLEAGRSVHGRLPNSNRPRR